MYSCIPLSGILCLLSNTFPCLHLLMQLSLNRKQKSGDKMQATKQRFVQLSTYLSFHIRAADCLSVGQMRSSADCMCSLNLFCPCGSLTNSDFCSADTHRTVNLTSVSCSLSICLCVQTAGLASRNAADPHPFHVAADARHGPPQYRAGCGA